MAETDTAARPNASELNQPLLNANGLVSIHTRGAHCCELTAEVPPADLRPGDQLAFPR